MFQQRLKFQSFSPRNVEKKAEEGKESPSLPFLGWALSVTHDSDHRKVPVKGPVCVWGSQRTVSAGNFDSILATGAKRKKTERGKGSAASRPPAWRLPFLTWTNLQRYLKYWSCSFTISLSSMEEKCYRMGTLRTCREHFLRRGLAAAAKSLQSCPWFKRKKPVWLDCQGLLGYSQSHFLNHRLLLLLGTVSPLHVSLQLVNFHLVPDASGASKEPEPVPSPLGFSLSVVFDSCDPMDCSPPGSSVYGILEARILEWVAIPFSRGSSQLRDRTQVSCIEVGFFTIWAIMEAH